MKELERLAGHSAATAELLKALGLEGQHVVALQLTLGANKLAEVDAVLEVDTPEPGQFTKVFQRYECVPRRPEPLAQPEDFAPQVLAEYGQRVFYKDRWYQIMRSDGVILKEMPL